MLLLDGVCRILKKAVNADIKVHCRHIKYLVQICTTDSSETEKQLMVNIQSFGEI